MNDQTGWLISTGCPSCGMRFFASGCYVNIITATTSFVAQSQYQGWLTRQFLASFYAARSTDQDKKTRVCDSE
ncbi:hypothetical protein T4D_7756 [Trichinella pseudospiralis]|uniref:Uncharacterized protein n=1 Tax=Trichinella pseudospiralis TaxID=6337 RepID=A0A0V1F415_TRIPS|nr:hypothetical protein T4D_7756 [Trichinella pseudospiralis]